MVGELERALARLQAVRHAVRARQGVRVAGPRARGLREQPRRLLAGGDLRADVAHQVPDQREGPQALLRGRADLAGALERLAGAAAVEHPQLEAAEALPGRGV